MSTGSAGSLQDPDSMEFESEGEENGLAVNQPEFERRNSVVEVSNTGLRNSDLLLNNSSVEDILCDVL
jgi:hypothetical protein